MEVLEFSTNKAVLKLTWQTRVDFENGMGGIIQSHNVFTEAHEC